MSPSKFAVFNGKRVVNNIEITEESGRKVMLDKKDTQTTVLLTGITGFVGHHIFEHIMTNTNWNVVGLQRNFIAGNMKRLDEVLAGKDPWKNRLLLLHHDLRDPFHMRLIESLPTIDVILHVGASSHVDRSILNPLEFMKDNVEGTINLLEASKVIEPKVFLYFSTDEVYGNAPDGVDYDEDSPHKPRNPYAASKAAAEDFAYSYSITYNVPLIITNTMNIIGERQDPEKYVPKIMNKVLKGETLSIHSYPDKQKAGQRHYLHARNAAAALLFILEHGEIGEKYNVVGEEEIDNLTLANLVHTYMDTDLPLIYKLVDFHSSRPGHDLRYSLDGNKLRNMGYFHPISFRESLQKTIQWTLAHSYWLQ